MSEQWQVTPDEGGDRWFYQRRTDSTGAPVVLELHFGIQAATVAAALHCYDAPAEPTGDNLDGCVFRIGQPSMDLYEQWLTGGRDDSVVVSHLAAVDVPVVAAQVTQSAVDQLQRENAALKAALAAMAGDKTPAVDPVPAASSAATSTSRSARAQRRR